MFTMYILQSINDSRYYIGSTDDLGNRLMRHSKGYSKYTKNKGLFKMVYKEEFGTRSDAKKREYYLKSLKSSKAIEKLINQDAIV